MVKHEKTRYICLKDISEWACVFPCDDIAKDYYNLLEYLIKMFKRQFWSNKEYDMFRKDSPETCEHQNLSKPK